MSDNKSFELFYFNGRGRAEPTRLALTAAKAKFTDTRVTDWPSLKPKTPQGLLPYLAVHENGKEPIKICQSMAILRYVGNLFGMSGKDSLEKVRVDEVLETCVDVLEKYIEVFFKTEESQREAKNAEFKKDIVPKFFGLLNTLVKDNGKGGFAVGDKLTIADCMLHHTVFQCGGDVEKFSNLAANKAKVEENADIKAYLAARPETKF